MVNVLLNIVLNPPFMQHFKMRVEPTVSYTAHYTDFSFQYLKEICKDSENTICTGWQCH